MTASTRQIRAARAVLEELPELLAEYRSKRGHAMERVAESTGINRPTLVGIEHRRAYSGSGEYNPKLDTVLAVMDYLAPPD